MTKAMEKAMLQMIKERPREMMIFMMLHFGKMAIEANAGTVNIKNEMDIDKVRYMVSAEIKVKKVKSKPAKP